MHFICKILIWAPAVLIAHCSRGWQWFQFIGLHIAYEDTVDFFITTLRTIMRYPLKKLIFVWLSYLKPHNGKIYDICWQLTSAFVIRMQISANPQISLVQGICFCVEWFTFIKHLFCLDDLSFQVTCTLLHIDSLHFFPVRPVNQTLLAVYCVTWDLEGRFLSLAWHHSWFVIEM